MSFERSSLVFSILSVITLSSCSEIDKQLEIAENRDLVTEVLEISDENTASEEMQQIEAESSKKYYSEARKLREAKKAEKERQEALKIAAAKQLAIQKQQEQAEKEKQIAKELEVIKQKLKDQKEAWTKYIGTEYDSLKLANGNYLKEAKVTEVRPTHVTFMHSGGIANVQFTDLRVEIRRICKYDPELAEISKKKQLELQRRIQARIQAEQALELRSDPAPGNRTSKSTTKKSQSKPSQPKSSTTVNPRGVVSVKTLGVNSNGIDDFSSTFRSKDDGQRKVIEVTAMSNVAATLRVNGSSYAVQPNVRLVQRVNLTSHRYTATLTDKRGKVLDEEKHNRKTGL